MTLAEQLTMPAVGLNLLGLTLDLVGIVLVVAGFVAQVTAISLAG